MSPRSQEFIAEARERLSVARDMIEGQHATAAVGQAYYAMLYAARAALSERGEHAKTHSGTWTLFAREFVATAEIPPAVGKLGQATQALREQADYEAEPFELTEAARILADAEQFVVAVEQALT